MCGIVSVKGKNATSKTIVALKKLEYRGYDSCGIAYKSGGLKCFKAKGYIVNLEEKLPSNRSKIAIGHTRWATHGKPNEINSHPHLSADGKFACVHNGIIENYKELKKSYLKDVKFLSDTDTEVIPNLVQYFYNLELGFAGKSKSESEYIKIAFEKTIKLLKGSFAIAIINEYDDNIYFARHSSPLVLSGGEDNIICSDINGLLDKSKVFYLPDDTYGYLDNTFHVFDKNGVVVDIKYNNYISNMDASLGSFPHYMLKEIYEIPSAISETYKHLRVSEFNLPKNISKILFVSCGTSYHSSLMAKKYIETNAKISVECEIASEYLSNKNLVTPDTLGVFISQSGETADTLKSLEKAKLQGLYTLAITNVENSHITHMADSTILMRAGAEICVASTKAYTTQLFVLIELANYLINVIKGNYKSNKFDFGDVIDGKLVRKPKFVKKLDISSVYKLKEDFDETETIRVTYSDTKKYLDYTSEDLALLENIDISELDKSLESLADKIYTHKTFHLIGKDYDYVTAMEGSLKIKEISYIFTDAYPCGELKHGTLSLIDENSIVFVIMTERELVSKTINAIHEVTSRGGKVIVLTQFDDLDLSDCYHVIRLPKLHQLFMPIVSIIPFHLLSYKITTMLGLNPDKPRNLAKSVTVE